MIKKGHKLKKQFVLFTRAGRCGQDGEWKINSRERDSRVYEAVQDQNWQRVDGVARV